jgi:hypothetical protein
VPYAQTRHPKGRYRARPDPYNPEHTRAPGARNHRKPALPPSFADDSYAHRPSQLFTGQRLARLGRHVKLPIMDHGQAPPAYTHANTADAELGPPVKQPSNVDERLGKYEIEELREQLEAEREQVQAEREQVQAEREQVQAEREQVQAERTLSEQARLATSTGPLLHSTESHTGPTGTDTKQPNPPSGGISWPDLVQGATSLTILLGLGLYGAVRFGHQIFCEQLGVRPEDIGLTYAASVSRAAVVLVVLAVCLGIILIGVTVLDNIEIPNLPKPIEFLTPVAAGLVGGAGGTFIVVVALVLASLLGVTSLFGIIAMIVGGFLIIRGVAAFVRGWRRRGTPNQEARPDLQKRPHPDRFRWLRNRSMVVLLACLLTAAAFIASGMSANTAANHIKNGDTVQASGMPGILGLHGEPVLATGDLADDLYLSNRLIMYLGQSDGSVVLYDVDAGWPMRLPADGISIVGGTKPATGEIVLKEGRTVDLDVVAAALESGEPIDLNAASKKQQDTDEFELALRGSAIQPATKLDPGSAVRIAKVDSGAAPRRATCAKATVSLKKQLPVAELREGVQLCIRTDLDRWIMLRVRRVKQSPVELTLQLIDWPG